MITLGEVLGKKAVDLSERIREINQQLDKVSLRQKGDRLYRSPEFHCGTRALPPAWKFPAWKFYTSTHSGSAIQRSALPIQEFQCGQADRTLFHASDTA